LSPTLEFITDVLYSVWNLSTHLYTLPWLKQLSSYLIFILLYISEGFTPSDHKKQIILWCSSTVQVDSGVALLYELLCRLVLLDHHDPYMAYC
jgi:hypothetical protein